MYFRRLPWGLTKTAMLSRDGCVAHIRRVDATIRTLEAMRSHAVQHTSLESITALAATISLPEMTRQEKRDLREPRAKKSKSSESSTPLWVSGWRDSSRSDTSSSSDEDEDWERKEDSEDAGTDQHKKPVLLCPWTEILPSVLETYSGSSTNETTDNLPESSLRLSFLTPILDAGVPHPSTISNHQVSTKDLLMLQKSIIEAQKFRNTVNSGLWRAQNAKKVKKSRWRRAKTEGRTWKLLKSFGFGSPLHETISISDTWPAQTRGRRERRFRPVDYLDRTRTVLVGKDRWEKEAADLEDRRAKARQREMEFRAKYGYDEYARL